MKRGIGGLEIEERIHKNRNSAEERRKRGKAEKKDAKQARSGDEAGMGTNEGAGVRPPQGRKGRERGESSPSNQPLVLSWGLAPWDEAWWQAFVLTKHDGFFRFRHGVSMRLCFS